MASNDHCGSEMPEPDGAAAGIDGFGVEIDGFRVEIDGDEPGARPKVTTPV